MLRTRVENYILPSRLKVKDARILMLGPISAGKSSYFNTIKSIFADRITHQAIAGSAGQSMTKRYRTYKIETSRNLNFCLCDTCGVEPKGRPDLADINYLVEGNILDGYEFGETAIHQNIRGFKSKPGLKDKIHCVAFVFDACKVQLAPKATWKIFFDVKCRLNTMDIPLVILLTKIDALDKNLFDDVSKVFLSNDVKKVVEYVAEKFQVPSGNVMPIKNYEKEMYCQDDISCLALMALDRMLGYSKDFLENQKRM